MKRPKHTIINDPIHGFIVISSQLIHDLISHYYVQRLGRIKQLGLTSYVFPGAQHTRFQHALGAMYLMQEALNTLRNKGHLILEYEYESALAAILLHDLGHGPFSHTLEHQLIVGCSHELITRRLIESLDEELNHRLHLALQMLSGEYSREFFHQLISSQLDVDRMDYLRRDSILCGIPEGSIGSERIIRMLDIYEDKIVVEEKGIFSVEKFLLARRLMYWQVYLHKTAMVTDEVLVRIIRRAKWLERNGIKLFSTPSLNFFLSNKIVVEDLVVGSETLSLFSQLDDYDIMSAIKVWSKHEDSILSVLCSSLIGRKLPMVISDYDEDYYISEKVRMKNSLRLSEDLIDYFVFEKTIGGMVYSMEESSISFLMKNGDVKDITEVSDIVTPEMLKRTTVKTYLCSLKPELFI